MHVLQLTTEFIPHIWGGMGRSVTNLSEELSKKAQLTVIVYDYLFPRNSIEIEKRNGYTIVWTPDLSYEKLSNFIDFSTVDVINVQAFFMAELALKINKPIIYTIRSVEEEDFKIRGIEITPEGLENIKNQNLLIEHSSQLIVCSEAEKEVVLRYFPKCNAKINVIPNGYPVPKRDEEKKSQLRVNDKTKDPIILFVGRFSERKGLHILVQAMNRVVEEHPGVTLQVIGGHSGENDYEWFQKLTENLSTKVKGRMDYVGWIESFDELQAYYANASALAVPSLYEPFGNIVLEAFYQGVPVVATKVGGMAEIITHKNTGILVKPEDPLALEEGLLEILNDVNLARNITEKAYATVCTQYTWERVAIDTLDVYKAVLSQRV